MHLKGGLHESVVNKNKTIIFTAAAKVNSKIKINPKIALKHRNDLQVRRVISSSLSIILGQCYKKSNLVT